MWRLGDHEHFWRCRRGHRRTCRCPCRDEHAHGCSSRRGDALGRARGGCDARRCAARDEHARRRQGRRSIRCGRGQRTVVRAFPDALRHRVLGRVRVDTDRSEQLRRLRNKVHDWHVLLGGRVRGDVHRAHVDALHGNVRRLELRQQELRDMWQRVPCGASLLGGRLRGDVRFAVCDLRDRRDRLLRAHEPRPRQLRRLRHGMYVGGALLQRRVRRLMLRVDVDAVQRPLLRRADGRRKLRRLRAGLRDRHSLHFRELSRVVCAVLRRRERVRSERRLCVGHLHRWQVRGSRVRSDMRRGRRVRRSGRLRLRSMHERQVRRAVVRAHLYERPRVWRQRRVRVRPLRGGCVRRLHDELTVHRGPELCRGCLRQVHERHAVRRGRGVLDGRRLHRVGRDGRDPGGARASRGGPPLERKGAGRVRRQQ